MANQNSKTQTTSDIMRDALTGTESFASLARGTTVDQMLGGFASGSTNTFIKADLASKAAKAAKAAMGSCLAGTDFIDRELSLLANNGIVEQAGKAIEKSMLTSQSARNEIGRFAGAGIADSIEKMTRDKLSTNSGFGEKIGKARSFMDEALGMNGGSIAKTLDDMKGLRGFDAGTIAEISNGFGSLVLASKELDDVMYRQDRDPLFEPLDRDHPLPFLPHIPQNPILKTNELLEDINIELAEQRKLIEATAKAQQEETALLAKLVDAFTNSQVGSAKATRTANRQAWIAIAIAFVGIIVSIVMAIYHK